MGSIEPVSAAARGATCSPTPPLPGKCDDSDRLGPCDQHHQQQRDLLVAHRRGERPVRRRQRPLPPRFDARRNHCRACDPSRRRDRFARLSRLGNRRPTCRFSRGDHIGRPASTRTTSDRIDPMRRVYLLLLGLAAAGICVAGSSGIRLPPAACRTRGDFSVSGSD